ncbi:MAG: DUF87 domain-containing protein [Ruminococcaceae bacterium]|nr:DUF87 domain-containing protein [Oscillospiraceae bacterium]
MADKKKRTKTTYRRTSGAKSTSKKTNTKGAKNSKSQSNINVDQSELIRWGVGFFALFMILTFIPAINSGVLGDLISKFFKGMFGPMYYVLPFLILLVVIMWGRDHENNVAGVKYLLYALEFVFISLVVQVAVADGEPIPVNQLYAKGIELKSAGLICGGVAMLFTSTIGNIPSLILAILGIFVSTVLLCGATPKDTVMAIVNYFREASQRIREEREIEEEELPQRIPARKSKKNKAEEFTDYENEPEVVFDNEPVFDIEKEDPIDDLPDDPMDESQAEPVSTVPEIIEETPVEEAETAASDLVLEDEDDEELCLEPIEDTPYVFPPMSLLTSDEGANARPSAADIARTSRRLEEILASFNVKAKVIDTTFGPTVTRYELRPETGVKVKAISNLAEDLALHLAAPSIRIESIPGKAAVGIEVPNQTTSTVRLRRLIDNPAFRDNKSRLFAALGEDVAGNPVYLDIAKMPHLLVAGATGQGKSVCINSLILSLLYRNHPNDVKLILIDPKTVEFSDFKDIPHLLVPVINDPKNAAGTLNWACTEMENRYKTMQEVGARDLMGYNSIIANDPERQMLPQIVIFIDEFADLMMTAPDDVETSVCRLAQKARAAGMHLVIGTQRPSVDVITGLIKANIPSRIALTTTSAIDSRTIIDQSGAEKLLGRGDMLYYPVGALKPLRVQGTFVDDKTEVKAVTQFIKEAAHAQYDESIINLIAEEAKRCGMKGKKGVSEPMEEDANEKMDPMFLDAVEVAIECGTVSTSLLQRRLSLGYARAARIVDKMQIRGYISEFDAATKKRSVLITREQFAELKLNGENKEEDGE